MGWLVVRVTVLVMSVYVAKGKFWGDQMEQVVVGEVIKPVNYTTIEEEDNSTLRLFENYIDKSI